ncbi:unnamed protein product [Cuscuta campestris]|uniref:TOG domain-containing protein n=1 Tax=Cuscuta campestris TaxID=132261 RepID=A0A484M2S3_9ASTE|nr:unnamed protein product [Cuscuta campestris]
MEMILKCSWVDMYAKEVCDAIVAKCLTGRPKTVEKAQTIFLLWVELEAVESFLDAMEKAIKNKVAKAVVPAVDVMFQALRECGSKVIPPKRILKMLPELFDHQDQNVRACSKGLTLELCRWVGKDPVKSILFEKMRDTMKKELEAELVNVTGTAKPTRKIRSAQDKVLEQDAMPTTACSGPSEESAADTAKWSEQKDAVAELTKLASTKRIAPGDFSEICHTLKKVITDVNIAVAVEAIQAIGNLARGLRAHFSGRSRLLLPVLLCLSDGTPEVRDAAFSALSAIAKLVGMRPLEKSIEKLDDVRRKKLSEMIAGASESDVAVPSSGAIVPSSTAADGSFVRRSATSMLNGKKAVQAAPEDMSLEQIESRIGSLIQPDTISMLKSASWKERVEAILSFKGQVMALQELDPSVEILIRFLSVVPGWNEKNVQVQQHIIDVISHISSTTSKFPKKCVILCLQGISERVADIKSRAQSMKCLTTFCEAVGPRFIFERLTMIMKEHKNPKVLSEGLLWMVTAIEDFGVSHLKLKDVIDFFKDVGLHSNAAATRNATIKLIGVLHKFVGLDIKGFLSDLKPALLSALDAEYEKNPFEGTSSVPKRTVKASDSVCVSGGGLDSLPRDDISGKITPALLKGLESSDWKIRLESIEGVNKILEEAKSAFSLLALESCLVPLGADCMTAIRILSCQLYLQLVWLHLLWGQQLRSHARFWDDKNRKILRHCDVTFDESVLYKDREQKVPETTKQVGVEVELEKSTPINVEAETQPTPEAEEPEVEQVTPEQVLRRSSRISRVPDRYSPSLHYLLLTDEGEPESFDEAIQVEDSVKWEQAMDDEMSSLERNNTWIPSEPVDIKYVLLLYEAEEFCNLVLNGYLLDHASNVRSLYPLHQICYLTNKLMAYINKREKMEWRGIEKVFRVKSSRQESLISSLGIGLQSHALINIKDSNKDERERTVIRKFKFEEPRLEQIQDLEALPSSRKEIIEVLDILLRWFVLRFCESNNTACILKVLECLPELFDMLRNEGCTMTEAEAAIFLPCLVEKDAMEKAIKNKVVKAVVPAVDVMFQALRECGSKVIPPKRILKMLPELFDHQDQSVRACSKGLTLELCRWVGKDPVKSILFEKMRDTMKKELEAELVNVTGTAKPTRKIRSAQDKVLEQDAMPTTACSGPFEESAADTHRK